ncbi:hypothetical protein WJU23_07535 [Prosthecobacter sp. SYSU 5D2]|uniref:hypothetical protein n=1 Tax=Prosthecobacter sp. SYSU 5D2 TaxID=3134134 RepID=UPI0031FF22D0
MAAHAPDTSTASATSQELQLFPEAEDVTPPAEQAPPVAEKPLQEARHDGMELPELPLELKNVARALEKALHDPGQLPGAFSNFCTAAYVKPDWAGAASEYLAVMFDGQQDMLAEMTRVPDLIIELGAGHYTLTFLVASRWAAKADLARLTRLAEALIATQSKIKSPEVVDLMLALTTSLAISRYSRAEQLLAAAEVHVTDDEREALKEAQLWLDAGSIVRGCTQEARDLWDQRLRRPRVAWTWNSPVECSALAQLSECLDTEFTAAALFKEVVPACWWALLVARTQERNQYETALAAAKAAARQQQEQRSQSSFGETYHEPVKQVVRQPIIIWRGIPFFIGGLVGACALLLGIWITPYELVRSSPETGAGAPAVFAPVETEASGEAGSSKLPVHPYETLRKEWVAELAAEVPELRAWVEKIEFGEWSDHELLLTGQDPALPADDPNYFKLLLWLHLDPPSNEEIRRQVPLLLAARRQDSRVIEIWEKLVYPGSLNAREIQAAALRTQHDQKEAWSPTQRALLSRIGAANLDESP